MSQHLLEFPFDSFALTWHPFQLDPKAPKGQSVDKLASYEAKYGAEGTQVIFERLRSASGEVGIAFKFGGRMGNTIDSHRLIEFAQEQRQHQSSSSGDQLEADTATRLAEELFADYFEREQDITDHSVLIKAAGRAGIDEGEAETFLKSDELALETKQKASDIRGEGINGVPQFILNDTFTVEGGQEPRAFLALFGRLKKREAAAL